MLTRAQLPVFRYSVFTAQVVHYLNMYRKVPIPGSTQVVSTSKKSSTFTMVYIAGFFHLALQNKHKIQTFSTNNSIHEKS